MDNLFNRDFRDLLISFNRNRVEYLIVGGYAVILHGYHRSTGDLDIWVNVTEENFLRLKQAFNEFGLPTKAIKSSDFFDPQTTDVFRFRRPPVSIDIMTHLKGVNFQSAYEKSLVIETDHIPVRLVNYDTLLKSKLASGRTKDLLDIEKLEEE
ncbi:MAG: hypothetical protein IPL46_06010 [Saprospiraceae bacterium]|nr:hypothetical protein [Saprospiraceae bacterium]